MANRHVISAHERASLASEQPYWARVHHLLLKDLFEHRKEISFVLWPSTNPGVTDRVSHSGQASIIDSDPRNLYISYNSTAAMRKLNGFGGLHWLCHYQVEATADRLDDYFLIASAGTVKLNIAGQLADLIRNADASSADDAIRLIEEWRNAESRYNGWDMQFHNQILGKPSAWSVVNGFRVVKGIDLPTMHDVFDERISLIKQLEIGDLTGYIRFWLENNPRFLNLTQAPIIPAADHVSIRDNIVQRLMFIHATASMYDRAIPLEQGQRHVTASDAPSHGSVRTALILRIQQLWPHVHAECMHLLPTTTQQRISRSIIAEAVGRVSQPEPHVAKHESSAKQRVVIPDDLKPFDLTDGDPIALVWPPKDS